MPRVFINEGEKKMPAKMSRKQRDHIAAKKYFRELVQLAKDRNPKMFGENPEQWDAQMAYIQGWLRHAELVEQKLEKAHRLIRDTHASDAAGHVRLHRVLDLLEHFLKEVDRRWEPEPFVYPDPKPAPERKQEPK